METARVVQKHKPNKEIDFKTLVKKVQAQASRGTSHQRTIFDRLVSENPGLARLDQVKKLQKLINGGDLQEFARLIGEFLSKPAKSK